MSVVDENQFNRIKAEIADSFDEELELQMEEDRLDDMAAEMIPALRASFSTIRSIFVNSFGYSMNWYDCRLGSHTRSSRSW